MRALYFAIPLLLVVAGCSGKGLVNQSEPAVQEVAIHQSIYPGYGRRWRCDSRPLRVAAR